MDDDFADRDHLLAGELARQMGVSTDTLRHYERMGVLPSPRRGQNGYRLYSIDSRERILLVRRALAVGFSLNELSRLLREREKGGAPCREVYQLAAEKLADVEERLAALAGLRDELRLILSDWSKRLSKTPSGEQSRLLESLTATPSTKNTGSRIAKLSPKSKKKGSRS